MPYYYFSYYLLIIISLITQVSNENLTNLKYHWFNLNVKERPKQGCKMIKKEQKATTWYLSINTITKGENNLGTDELYLG